MPSRFHVFTRRRNQVFPGRKDVEHAIGDDKRIVGAPIQCSLAQVQHKDNIVANHGPALRPDLDRRILGQPQRQVLISTGLLL
jgi:hypothetical protein